MNHSKNSRNAAYYAEGVLRGDIAVLSRAITLAESTNTANREMAREIIRRCGPSGKQTFRLGITGVPGVGKSTFIETFGLHVRQKGQRLAVLTVDPTSAKSKGSILGDKTRMQKLSAFEDVYIRPSPSAGALGGVTRVTYETIVLCEAAGFDYVIVETVGVGQSEVGVSRITDFFLLLMLAGAGDELQGIKRGIMEMADALVITKADSGNEKKAAAARAEYSRAIRLFQPHDSGWQPPVLVCSALADTGISEIDEMITKFRNLTMKDGFFAEHRRRQQLEIFREALREAVLTGFNDRFNVEERLRQLDAARQQFDPYAEVAKALRAAGF